MTTTEIALSDFDDIVNETNLSIKSLVTGATRELDEVMSNIASSLKVQSELTVEQLEWYTVEIPSIIYHTISNAEINVTKEALAKLLEKETLNKNRKHATGTVAEKQCFVEQQASMETLIKTIYSIVNKNINKKIEVAQDMLNSIKKILTLRITELEISNNKYTNMIV